MNKKSKYFDKSASYIISRCNRNVRIRTLIGILGLYSIFLYLQFSRRDSIKWYGIAFLVIPVLTMHAFNRFMKNERKEIGNILVEDCDPYKYWIVQQQGFMKQRKWFPVSRKLGNAEKLAHSLTMYYMEEWEEGILYLDEVESENLKLTEHLEYLVLYARYYSKMNQKKEFYEVKKKFQELPKDQKAYKKNTRYYMSVAQSFQMSEALLEPNINEAKSILEDWLKRETRLLFLVEDTLHLAYVELLTGDEASAKEHLQYVIENGNKTNMVKEATELLNKMSQPVMES